MAGMINNLKNRLLRMGKKMDQYQQDLTNAEAGLHECVAPNATKETCPGKLLVVGAESRFPEAVISYAVEMAARMSYDIIALNTLPLNNTALGLFSLPQKEVQNDFIELSRKQVVAFQEAAEKNSIRLDHVVKFKEVDAAIEEIRKDYPTLEFIIESPQEKQAEDRPENRENLRRQIQVYTM